MEIKNRRTISFIIPALILIGVIIISWNNIGPRFLSQDEASQRIHGTVTHIEPGKDGVQVELETENGLYNVTISIIQAEIVGDFEQIKIGTTVEVTGQLLDGMSLPLIVAEKVTVLEHED